MEWIYVICGIGLVLALLFAWSLCKVAADADKHIELLDEKRSE